MATSETAQDWRDFPLTRLRMFANRSLGSLNEREFRGLCNSGLLDKIRGNWDQAASDIHDLYHAILQRQQAEAVNLSEEPIPITMAMAEPPEHFEEITAEQQPTFRPSQEGRSVAAQTDPARGAFMSIPADPSGQRFVIKSVASPNDVEDDLRRDVASSPAPSVLARTNSPDTNGVEQIPVEATSPEPVPIKRNRADSEVFTFRTRSDTSWELKRLGKESAEQRILEILEVADAAISQAQSLEAARNLCGVAEIVHTCTSELDMAREIQNEAASFVIHAEFHAGELLRAARNRGDLATGTRNQLHGRTPTGEPNIVREGSPFGVPNGAPPEKSTLADAGIDKNFAKRIRRWGDISRPDLEARIEEKRAEGKLTKIAVLADAKPKPAPAPSKHLVALLRHFRDHGNAYDAAVFANNQALIKLYREVAEPFTRFLGALDVESIGCG